MNSPCKNCNDRKIGCHSTCDKYELYSQERQLIREGRYKQEEQDLVARDAKIRIRRSRFTRKDKDVSGRRNVHQTGR